MSGFTFSHSGDPTEIYTIKAATIYGSTDFIVDKATLHVPYEVLPVAMLILWLCGHDFTLQTISEARLDLQPEYDCDSDEDIQHIEAVDEIEAWYWLYKLAHDTKLIDLRDEVTARYLNAINTGTPWLIGDLWECIDDVYQ